MWDNLPATPIYENVTQALFEREILTRNRPAVLKGAVKDWPLIQQTGNSPAALCTQLKLLAAQTPDKAQSTIESWWSDATTKGRFFLRQ